MGNTVLGSGFSVGRLGALVLNPEFEICVRHLLDIQVEMSSRQLYIQVWSLREVQAGDVDLGVISIWMVYNGMRLSKFTSRVNIF